jgi:endonuclease/exonuclease/phosphatase family metal-dependent hydrolase
MLRKIAAGLTLALALNATADTQPSAPSATTNVVFMGFNIWHNGTKVEDSVAKIRDVIAAVKPDVVAFSEINGEATARAIMAGLESAVGKYFTGYLSNNDVAIISRFPITRTGPLVGSRISMFEVSVHGSPVLIGGAHLDYTHYACYLPRGCACGGSPPYTGWDQIGSPEPRPVTNLSVIAAQNLASQRDEQVGAFLEYVKAVQMPVILIGDFNEPSHLDWTTNQAGLFDHNGVVFPWPTTLRLHENGFVDAFRKIYPDEVRNPGFTWPSFATGKPSTSWAARSDDRERIDYIFYKGAGVETTGAALVGPKGSYVRNALSTADTDHDRFIADHLPWPSDHKAILATLTIPLGEALNRSAQPRMHTNEPQ